MFLICSGFWSLFILRLLMGICFGFCTPLTTTTMVEHLPVKNRGRWVVLVNFFITIGKLWGVLLAAIFLTNLESGNWRIMMAVSGITPLMTLLGALFFMIESPRFCLFNNRESHGFRNLKIIQKFNLRNPKFLLNQQKDKEIAQGCTSFFICKLI